MIDIVPILMKAITEIKRCENRIRHAQRQPAVNALMEAKTAIETAISHIQMTKANQLPEADED